MLDGVKRMIGINAAGQEVPIYPPSYPEYAPLYGASEQEDMTGTFGVTLDNSSLIINIRSFLSGQEQVQVRGADGKTRTEWQRIAEAKMNEKGVRAIILELRARLDKNTIMTYIPDEERLDRFLREFSCNLAIFLGRNAENFEIKDNYLSEISDFIVDQVEITLLRGLNGNEKQGVYKQSKRIETFNMPVNSPSALNNGRNSAFR